MHRANYKTSIKHKKLTEINIQYTHVIFSGGYEVYIV